MERLLSSLEEVPWIGIRADLELRGYALLQRVIDDNTCSELMALFDDPGNFRKSISMERYRFGKGEYKYFRYPLHDVIQTIRERIYPELASVANRWMQQLGIETKFPSAHDDFLQTCRIHGQTLPTVLILKYGQGGYNTLHQDLYGEVFFPFQLVLFLNEPGEDYEGGEFVLTEQIPRAQSKAIVLRPGRGDMLLFTTNFRPVKGSRGYYRVSMKHGVSEVSRGERNTLGIIFHDARS